MAMAVAAAAAAARGPAATIALPILAGRRSRGKDCFTPLHVRALSTASDVRNSNNSEAKRELVLYTKPGCCLCEGLKEKLQLAFSLSGPHSLHHVQLQIRDISTNPEWEKAYQYEIPVLARVLSDGTELGRLIVEGVTNIMLNEETLPRLSPRLGVQIIQKKIAAALEQ